VTRTAAGVRVSTGIRTLDYDRVILATHPPQTREILGDTMTAEERDVLSAFDYWPNDVVIHSDPSFLPSNKRAWASWNWFAETGDLNKTMLMLTYQLNTLQALPPEAPIVMETLNLKKEPAEGTVLARLSFDHPMYSAAAIAAQRVLPRIQGVDRLYFAGAWTRYGFHEDGLLSGVRIAESLGATLPWGDQLDVTRTQVLSGAPTPLLGQLRQLTPGETTPLGRVMEGGS
jgi:predicted NAD/FAD-binding protein